MPIHRLQTPDLLKISLSESVQQLFCLGIPAFGQATGFVVSRRHRLVATAAHVADLFANNRSGMLAVFDGTCSPCAIDKVWYHPGIVRELGDGLYGRSDDPRDGEIGNRVPDVAVIQLSLCDSALPEELNLATEEELRGLDGRVVGFLGYPGDRESRWPTTERPARATFATSLSPGPPPRLKTKITRWRSANGCGLRMALDAAPAAARFSWLTAMLLRLTVARTVAATRISRTESTAFESC